MTANILEKIDPYYFDRKYTDEEVKVINSMPREMVEDLSEEEIKMLLDYQSIYGTKYTIEYFDPKRDDEILGPYESWVEFVNKSADLELEDMEAKGEDTSGFDIYAHERDLRRYYRMGNFGYVIDIGGIEPEEAVKRAFGTDIQVNDCKAV